MQELSKYQKLSIQLKGFLKGRGYHKALEAYEFAKNYHINTRKDGITPEFQHQVEIALFAMTLRELRSEETVIIAILLHDVREDYDISHKEIVDKFGIEVGDVVEKLTKKFKGIKKSSEQYFEAISTCPHASVVKLIDRVNNVSSMGGVFSIDKQKQYIKEVDDYFLPMLKKARKNFPDQAMSYYNLGTFLKTLCKTISATIAAEKKLISNQSISFKP